MQILLPASVAQVIAQELRKCGRRETGGLIFAEHIGGETFKIVEITTQQRHGTSVEFVRDQVEHKQQLDTFFERTGDDCTRFNYFGEWHSHPSFPPVPSGQDLRTMRSILEDPNVGVNFLVLMIVRLVGGSGLELSATVCDGGSLYQSAAVFIEVQPALPQKRKGFRMI